MEAVQSIGMRLAKVSRIPNIPSWAATIVAAHFGLVGLYVWLTHGGSGAPTTCMFHRLTGYPCPTCGSTRMVVSAFHGDFVAAFLYNPLMFLLALLAIAWLVLRVGFGRRIVWRRRRHRTTTLAIVIVILITCNWLWLAHTL